MWRADPFYGNIDTLNLILKAFLPTGTCFMLYMEVYKIFLKLIFITVLNIIGKALALIPILPFLFKSAYINVLRDSPFLVFTVKKSCNCGNCSIIQLFETNNFQPFYFYMLLVPIKCASDKKKKKRNSPAIGGKIPTRI